MAPVPEALQAIVRRAVQYHYKDPSYVPGGISMNPTHVNNQGFFALFAILGVAMVLAAIWFFFWAKNGGFRFRQGDWDEYKSTVLRRKGPNGTTLSGATRTTKLGGGSVVADADDDDEKGGWRRGAQNRGKKGGKSGDNGRRGNKNNDDEDVRAYRHEKAARVGGLNREADGVAGRDYAAATSYGGDLYTDDLSSNASGGYVPINTPRKAKNHAGAHSPSKPSARANDPATPTPKKNRYNSHIYSTPGSNNSTDSHRPLRPNAAQPGSGDSTPTRTPRHTPHKPTRSAAGSSMPGTFYTDPLDFENRYTPNASEAGTETSRGTKAYFHPIPGLGKGGGGYRRGGGYGRGGNLSDSD